MTLIGLIASALHLQSKENFTRDAVAAVLMGEARSEGVAGLRAVAEVVRNRGGDPLKVVTAHRQFSCLNNRTVSSLVRAMKQEEEWPIACSIANVLLKDPAVLGNSAKRANHFEQIGKTPFWAVGLKPVATIGKLNFYICK